MGFIVRLRRLPGRPARPVRHDDTSAVDNAHTVVDTPTATAQQHGDQGAGVRRGEPLLERNEVGHALHLLVGPEVWLRHRVESDPAPLAAQLPGHGNYAVKHNPWAYFTP